MNRRWRTLLPAVVAILGTTAAPGLATSSPTQNAMGPAIASAGLQPGTYTCSADGAFDLSTAASLMPGFDLVGSGTCTRSSGPTYHVQFTGGGYDITGFAPCQFALTPGSTPPVQGVPPSVDETVTLTKGSQTYRLTQTWNAVGADPYVTVYPTYAATISPSGTVFAFLSGAPSGTCEPSPQMGHYPLTFRISFSQ